MLGVESVSHYNVLSVVSARQAIEVKLMKAALQCNLCPFSMCIMKSYTHKNEQNWWHDTAFIILMKAVRRQGLWMYSIWLVCQSWGHPDVWTPDTKNSQHCEMEVDISGGSQSWGTLPEINQFNWEKKLITLGLGLHIKLR